MSSCSHFKTTAKIRPSAFLCQSQYRFVCEAILKVYEEGLVKPLTTAIYQQREKVTDEREEEKKEQQKAGTEREETAATEEGEAAVVELLEEGLDEEEDDDEEVEVLDVGEVTEEDDDDDEEVEEPSVASATSMTSVTSATNADPDLVNLWPVSSAGRRGLPGRGQVAGGENKSTVALYAEIKWIKDKHKQTWKVMDEMEFKKKEKRKKPSCVE